MIGRFRSFDEAQDRVSGFASRAASASRGKLLKREQGIKPVFAPTEALDEFERYTKVCHEIFRGR